MTNMPRGPQEPLPVKNYIVAIVLSLLILVGFSYFAPPPKMANPEQVKIETPLSTAINGNTERGGQAKAFQEDPVFKSTARVHFSAERVKGSVALQGGFLDELFLKDYYKTVENKEQVELFRPKGSTKPFYAEYGWVSQSGDIAVPTKDTVWQGQETLNGVKLTWDNGQGLTFQRDIEIDDKFMFTVTQSVVNQTGKDVTLFPYGLVSQQGIPEDYMQLFILHQGPVSFLGEELEEESYGDLEDDKIIEYKNKKGWVGFADKYWFVSLAPEAGQSTTARFVYSEDAEKKDETSAEEANRKHYQADIMGSAITISAGSTEYTKSHLFAGAKELDVLQSYEESLGLENMELAIDFGIFSIITKPLFLALTWVSELFGHVGLAIVFITLMIRLLAFPLTNKSFKSMAGMQKLGPEMKKIKENYGADREGMQKALMELYQKENINPFSGCWPVLIQIPIFFSLYKVILINVILRHAPFWGWIDDLSVADPTTVFNLFGLISWDPPSVMMVGAWPVMMGLTMFWHTRMSPKPTDSTQAMIKNYLPYLFTFMMSRFAAGLVIYWTCSNFLSVIQQYVIMKGMGAKISFFRGHLGHLDKTDESEEAGAYETSETTNSELGKADVDSELKKIEVSPKTKAKPKKKTAPKKAKKSKKAQKSKKTSQKDKK